MTTAQIWKYRAEWAKAWKHLRAAGVAACDREKTRKRWHVLIGAVYRRGREAGVAKSSTVLTNAEFDAFLKRCAATHTPDGLAEQLRLDGQPELRALTACAPLLDEIAMAEESRSGYIAGIYRNVQRTRERALELHEMPDDDLQLVLVALTHTVQHKLGVGHNHPTTGKGPRSQYAHRVGHRRTGDAVESADADEPLDRSEPDPAYQPRAGEAF